LTSAISGEAWIQKLLERSRYIRLVGIVALLLAPLVACCGGAAKTVKAAILFAVAVVSAALIALSHFGGKGEKDSTKA
jgi:hypothetical protein